MSDSEPTTLPVSPFDAWQQQERDYARVASEALLANKTALFDALAAAGISTVIVDFDGYGDSGQIESVDVRAGEEERELPTVEIEIASMMWGSGMIERRNQPVSEAIETLTYEILE